MRVLQIMVGAYLIGGCATAEQAPGPLNRAALRASRPRTILATDAVPPSFDGVTSGAALWGAFGLLGLLAQGAQAAEEGREVRKKAVYDPAAAMRTSLAQALAKRFSLIVVDTTEGKTKAVPASAGGAPKELTEREKMEIDHPNLRPAPPENHSVEALAHQYPHVDLVLDIRTSKWGFVPVRIGHYGINYEGILRLIDTRTKKVIAEGTCQSLPVDTHDAPSYDELLANQGAVLKIKLASLEEFCTNDYRTRILGLYGQ